MTSTWYTADKAYQAHHVSCADCRAAGARPGELQRCEVGLALWNEYNQAGTPPHLMPRVKAKDASDVAER